MHLSAGLTLGEFFDAWVETTLPGRLAAKTLADYRDTIRLHLRPRLGATQLTGLTVREVDALWTLKREAGYKPNSIRIMRSVLRSALRQAQREGLVASNVADLSTPPRLGHGEGRSLTVAQARMVLQAVTDDRLEACYALMLTYGLRRGEVLGLAWADLSEDEHVLLVRCGLKREQVLNSKPGEIRTRLVRGDLKTRGSRRRLPVTPPLLEILAKHRTRQDEERQAAGEAWLESGLMFTTPIGTAIDPNNFAHSFPKVFQRAGLGHWHPHELRHTAASIMLAQGVPLWVVSNVLGHSSVAITKDVYGHLLGDDVKRDAAEVMTSTLFDSERKTGLEPAAITLGR